MELFERAHVSSKESSKKMNRSEGAMKMQLKKMLNAYKKGNNQEIKSVAESQQEYDVDDMKSVSGYSDIIFHKEPTAARETVSFSTSEELQLSSGDTSSFSTEHVQSSSKDNATESDCSVTPESLTEFYEELKSVPSPGRDNNSTVDCELTSSNSLFDSSVLSEACSDSEISIPSSLQTSSGSNDASGDETFDPDRALANRILERLGKKQVLFNKRKLAETDKILNCKNFKKEKMKDREVFTKTVTKKENKIKIHKEREEIIKINDQEIRDAIYPRYRNMETEMSEDSLHDDGDFDNSQDSDNSSQFVSISAMDMHSQSLSDIVGDYVHPTIRNLPSEKQNIVSSQTGTFAIFDDVMNVDNCEDLSSLIPEIDDELAIEDLTLEPEPQEQNEESTAFDDTVQTEDYFEHESSTANIVDPTPVQVKVYNSNNCHIIVMNHPTEIFIHGKVNVQAIGGSVEIFGYTLQDETIDLYAPYLSFAHSIKTIENLSEFNGLFSRLLSTGLTAIEAKEIVSTVNDYDAVIALSKLNCPKIDFVDKNFTVTELFTKRVDQTPRILKKVAGNLGCSIYLESPRRVLEEKSNWEQHVACGKTSQSRGIICGGKGTGKSTLLRYQVNRLLYDGPVLVIDLDPGQAEFTIPGNVSVTVVDSPLIGPNFTHLKKPQKMLNIGIINTMDNPSRYISAVKELISYCRSNEAFHKLPWIVNTMGMCNNMGLKFIMYIILELQPTYVYQIDSKIPKKRFEIQLQSHAITSFYEEHKNETIYSGVKEPNSLDYTFILGLSEEWSSPQKGNVAALSPKDERYLNVLAYFGQLLEIYRKSILEIVPYEVNLRDLSVGLNIKIPAQALAKVINGKIIALCQLDAPDKEKMFILGDNALVCHGYGLIRGIDFENERLYILTPLLAKELQSVNCLVYADWMPELSKQEKDLPSGTVIPYRTATVFQERRLMFPPKRRFNPIQLLKATRTA